VKDTWCSCMDGCEGLGKKEKRKVTWTRGKNRAWFCLFSWLEKRYPDDFFGDRAARNDLATLRGLSKGSGRVGLLGEQSFSLSSLLYL
jgi:hypothetical protein